MPNAISTSHEPHHAAFFEEARFPLESRIPAPNFIVARAMSVVTSTLRQNTENDKSGYNRCLKWLVTSADRSVSQRQRRGQYLERYLKFFQLESTRVL